MKGMNFSTKMRRHSSLLLQTLKRFKSSEPSALSLWWFLKRTSNLGITSVDTYAIEWGFSFDKREKASIGRCIHSRGVLSSSFIIGVIIWSEWSNIWCRSSCLILRVNLSITFSTTSWIDNVSILFKVSVANYITLLTNSLPAFSCILTRSEQDNEVYRALPIRIC